MGYEAIMLIFVVLCLLLFAAGLGFAVYGLITFLRNRQSKRGDASGSDARNAAGAAFGPAAPGTDVASYSIPAPSPDRISDGAHDAEGDTPAAVPETDAQTTEAQATNNEQDDGNAVAPATASGRAADIHPGQAARLFSTGGRKTMHLPSMPLSNFSGANLLIRSLLIAAITLLLLIPLGFISDIVDERGYLHKQTLTGLAQEWGRSQVVNGPALIIPYETWHMTTEHVRDAKGVVSQISRRVVDAEYKYKYVLPKTVSFSAALTPQTRYRSIYQFVVYTTPLEVTGIFVQPAEADFGKNLEAVHWDKAYLALGIADLKAITKVQPLIWNSAEAPPFNPGTDAGNLLGSGFHAPAPVNPAQKEQTFKLSLHVNGSGGIHFTPVGETTEISVTGDWGAPKFSGNLLPTTRTISDSNFSAHWSIPHLSRTYPQVGDVVLDSRGSGSITEFVAGVDLYEMVSLYRLVTRAVKYGILFIGLTFVALLSFELATRGRLHLVQYGLVGIAMSLFYLVLLSLAEHTSFFTAFIAASAVSVAMNGLYIAAALRSKGKGLVIITLLSGLYGVLYALLKMEDYALLVGTVLVMLVVGVLMFLTRSLPVHGEQKSIR